MSHKMLRPFIVKVSVLGYFHLAICSKSCDSVTHSLAVDIILVSLGNYSRILYTSHA